jgi:hypothetical protein
VRVRPAAPTPAERSSCLRVMVGLMYPSGKRISAKDS